MDSMVLRNFDGRALDALARPRRYAGVAGDLPRREAAL